MAIDFRSTLNDNVLTQLDDASRDDLRPGDKVDVEVLSTHTTYAWNIAYKPEGSTAAFSGDPTAQSPGHFFVDLEGPYLIRVIVDLGLPTQEEVSYRLRFKTIFGDLCLVAGGENINGNVPVPIDIDAVGWAYEQNANLQTLLGYIATVSASGNILYVDSNAGTEGYADHDTIQAAITEASGTATASTPWIIAIRPGDYDEDLTMEPHVHLIGWPGDNGASEFEQRSVQVRAATGTHTVTMPSVGDHVLLSNITFENVNSGTGPVIAKDGLGSMAIHRCSVLQSGVDASQGPAVRVNEGTAVIDSSFLSMGPTAPSDRAALLQNGASLVQVFNSTIVGPSGVLLNPGLTVSGVQSEFRDTRVVATSAGGTGILTDAESLLMEYCRIEAPTGDPILAHPSAAAFAGDVGVTLRWCYLDGAVNFDGTGIGGTASLNLGSSEYTTLTFPGGVPTLTATTKSSSLFYDNTSSLPDITAENVQDALDQIFTYASEVRSLDDAYDAGIPNTGTGRRIIADQGAVEIVDDDPPSTPPPAGNSDGQLRVVGNVQVGAIGEPEIDLDPNTFGNGPIMRMGQLIWAGDAPFGSTATIMGSSTGLPLGHNYNLRVQTESSLVGGEIGRLILRGGDGLSNGAITPDAGSVYVQAGSGLDAAAGAAGDIYLAPGDSQFSTPGSVIFVRPQDATAATLTAAGAFVGGVTGTINFATDMGGFTVDVDAGDALGTVLAAFNATGQVTAVDSGGGVIELTSASAGPTAEIFFLGSDPAGLDTALGTFAGQTMVLGTWPSAIRFAVSADNEITVGAGAANPMVYNADTGKLTVPGIIDPIGLVLEETVPLTADPGKGVIFIGDGTGGTTLGNFYFRYEGGVLQDISAVVGGAVGFTIEDEGVTVPGGPHTILDFRGSGVTATDQGAGRTRVTITSGGGVVSGVDQEVFAASAFTFGGGVSSVTLSSTFDTAASVAGLVTLLRNGVGDMNNVGPAVPSTETEYRINGTDLEIGADIVSSGDDFRIIYPIT